MGVLYLPFKGPGGGGAAASYRDSISAVGSGTSMTVNPSTLTYQNDDVLVLFGFGYVSLGAPTGSDLTWTERLSKFHSGPFGTNVIQKVWTAVADASITSFTIANGASDQYGHALVSVSNADTTAPVDASAIDSNVFGTVNNPTSPSVSPVGSNSLLLCAAGVWPGGDSASSFTPPSGMTEIEDWESWDSYSVAYQSLVSAGATGAKAFTESPALTGGTWIASSIAIKTA